MWGGRFNDATGHGTSNPGGPQGRRDTPQMAKAEGDWYCTGCADRQFGKNHICRNCGTPKEMGVANIADVPMVLDKFLSGRGVDPEIEAQLRMLPPELQKNIMERGSLFSARDPSAVLRQRMNEINCPRRGDWYCPTCHDLQFAKNESCRGCGGARRPEDNIDGGTPQLPDATTFLSAFAIDPAKMQQFLEMDPGLQAAVIAKGTLAGARDPTAVLGKRMREVCEGGGFGGGPPGGGRSGGSRAEVAREGDWYCSQCHDLQFAKNASCRRCGSDRAAVDNGGIPDLPDPVTFLAGHNIEEEKMMQFLRMDPQMQVVIMTKGSLVGSRDPTAVLVSRMNSVLKGEGGAGGAGGPQGFQGANGGPRDGDWYCKKCHDLQFARNDSCRCCGTARTLCEAIGGPQLPNASDFLLAFDIEDDRKLEFLKMPVDLQTAIIAKGTLQGARDPTAVLISRMNQVMKDAGLGRLHGPGSGKGKNQVGGGIFGSAQAAGGKGAAGPYGGAPGKAQGGKGQGKEDLPDWIWEVWEQGYNDALAQAGQAQGGGKGGGGKANMGGNDMNALMAMMGGGGGQGYW